jgi:hypothetical protein
MTKYSATVAGQTFTRKSERTYTHVVVARAALVEVMRTFAEGGSYWTKSDSSELTAMGFCGSLALAQKKAADVSKRQEWDSVQIIPVTAA